MTQRAEQLVSNLPASLPQLLSYVEELVKEGLALVTARESFAQITTAMRQEFAKANKRPALEDAINAILPLFQPRAMSFEDQTTSLRIISADILEDQERWRDAATKLSAIPLESGHRQVDNDFKLEVYLRIGALLMEDGDSVQAETYVTRASAVALQTQNQDLTLKFKALKARIDDAKRNFIEAAQRYIDLAYSIPDEAARLISLTQAIVCTVLAPAGQRRSRLLATLYKDERTRTIPTFPVLEAMYLGLMVKKEDLATFAKTLAPHQLAQTSDGTTILDKAMVQHNILSATKIYKNVAIHELGSLLQISPEQAEKVVANMISEGRLSGTIDQITGFVQFEDATNAVLHWDSFIQDVCLEVNNTLALIAKEQPAWYQQHAHEIL